MTEPMQKTIKADGVQVDRSLYATSEYCLPGRFAAYSYQIREILEAKAQSVLEIGPGNGVVTHVLRQAGIRVDTLDHDPALKPDMVGSVLALPVDDQSYDAVLCCQVLEHLPWENFPDAVRSIARVVRKSIILSFPHASKHNYIDMKLPRLPRFRWDVDRAISKTRMEFNGEHYWELGRGLSEKDVLQVFDQLKLDLYRSYRVPEFRPHHFFCLHPRHRNC